MKTDNLLSAWNARQGTYFDNFSDAFGIFNFDTESPISRQMSYKFIELLGLSSGSRLLEFGCGRGEWVIRLAKLGYQIDGFDISQKSVEKLKEYVVNLGLERQVNLFTADAQKDSSPNQLNQKYNTVFCYNLLHHVADITQVVENMVNASTKGGVVIAYEPNPCPLFDKRFNWNIEKGLLKTSPPAIKNIFEKSGLSNVEIIPWDYFPFISPEKTFNITGRLQSLLLKIPLFKYLSAVYIVRGYKL